MSLSVAFLTLRMSLTALVFAACGPPVEMAALMSSLYILHMLHTTFIIQNTDDCNTGAATKHRSCSVMSSVVQHVIYTARAVERWIGWWFAVSHPEYDWLSLQA